MTYAISAGSRDDVVCRSQKTFVQVRGSFKAAGATAVKLDFSLNTSRRFVSEDGLVLPNNSLLDPARGKDWHSQHSSHQPGAMAHGLRASRCIDRDSIQWKDYSTELLIGFVQEITRTATKSI
jgi:hypothetical protein